jgi:DNA replication protein DnaC
MNDPKAVPLASGDMPNLCPNCGGHQILMVYVVKDGPFQTPTGGKVKWLDMPDGKSGWYAGELKVAFCPACRASGLNEYLLKNCGLEGSDLSISLGDFSVVGSYARKQAAKEMAGRLLGMNDKPGGFITFYGAYGCGKSHLLKALDNGFRAIGEVAQYQVMSEMLASIRERFGNEQGQVRAEDVIEHLQRIRVLCLDEIERINLTGWAKETVFRVMDTRYNRTDLLTVMATNCNPDDLPPEFGYLSSRMRAGVIVEVPGPDVREALGMQTRRVYGME